MPGLARWLTLGVTCGLTLGIQCVSFCLCSHGAGFSSRMLHSSWVHCAAYLVCFRSASENALSYLMSYFLVHGILLHSWSRCLWVSSSFSQNLHMISLCWFLWLNFAGIILLLSFTMALHCFLLSLFMCSGRFPGVAVALLSAHSLTLDFTTASFSTVLFICSAMLVSSSFLGSVSFLERFLREFSVHSLSS